MKTSKISRLLALSDSEYDKRRIAPVRQRFKARNVNLSALDRGWERERGAAARMMGIILKENSDSLYQKVSADPQTAATYSDALGWLHKEAQLLRRTASRFDLAASRLGSALNRYRESGAADSSAPAGASLPSL